MRVAAVGDLHVGTDVGEEVAAGLADVAGVADVLLLAGDLTRCGEPAEAQLLANILEDLQLPIIAVLGNHDYHADRVEQVVAILGDAGVTVLEGEAVTVAVGDASLGVAGTKGFGGGFIGASATEFGEPAMKQFARAATSAAEGLERALHSLRSVDQRLALLHYSPIRRTLVGEHIELYPLLGSYLLSEAIDRAGADLVLHGHAHHGSERGLTPGGIRVRNVAQPVLRRSYRVFELAPAAVTP